MEVRVYGDVYGAVACPIVAGFDWWRIQSRGHFVARAGRPTSPRSFYTHYWQITTTAIWLIIPELARTSRAGPRQHERARALLCKCSDRAAIKINFINRSLWKPMNDVLCIEFRPCTQYDLIARQKFPITWQLFFQPPGRKAKTRCIHNIIDNDRRFDDIGH